MALYIQTIFTNGDWGHTEALQVSATAVISSSHPPSVSGPHSQGFIFPEQQGRAEAES